jgi:hypothetical protein
MIDILPVTTIGTIEHDGNHRFVFLLSCIRVFRIGLRSGHSLLLRGQPLLWGRLRLLRPGGGLLRRGLLGGRLGLSFVSPVAVLVNAIVREIVRCGVFG